jgi:hypothetical protein
MPYKLLHSLLDTLGASNAGVQRGHGRHCGWADELRFVASAATPCSAALALVYLLALVITEQLDYMLG